MFRRGLGYRRGMKEIDCVINGDEWSSEFNGKREVKKGFKDRVYWKDCGVGYDEDSYKEVD